MTHGFVRPARLDDVVEITRIQLTTWRVAYRRLLPQHILDQLDEDWITRRWRDAIAEPPSPAHRVLVAVEQIDSPDSDPKSAYVVGFAASGPADDTALAPDEDHTALDNASDKGIEGVVAITDLLVEPRWGRRGHGSRLLAASVDLWRSDGFTTALAWTFADDRVTRRFLEGAGWAPDGVKRSLDIDDLLVGQVRWHVSLEGEPPGASEEPVTGA